MKKRETFNLNSKNVIKYKGVCYRKLEDILIDKNKYKELSNSYLENINNVDSEIKVITNKIKEIRLEIKKLDIALSNLDVELYACSYRYESLSKKRMKSFEDFKNDSIDISEHNQINRNIDMSLDLYKEQYDRLIDKLNILKSKKKELIKIYNDYKSQKNDLIITKKYYLKKLSISNKNIQICDSNIDSINETLENIDMLYFSGEENVCDNDITPKVKKMHKIKE